MTMKIRLLSAFTAAMFATAAAAQTAQDAEKYLAEMCAPEHTYTIEENGMAKFTDIEDDSATVDLKDIGEVLLDSDGDTLLSCRKFDNPFASPNDRINCVNVNEERSAPGWYMLGCWQYEGVAKAIHFLIKQHNPEVELNLEPEDKGGAPWDFIEEK